MCRKGREYTSYAATKRKEGKDEAWRGKAKGRRKDCGQCGGMLSPEEGGAVVSGREIDKLVVLATDLREEQKPVLHVL